MSRMTRTVLAAGLALALVGSATHAAGADRYATAQVGDTTIPIPVSLADQNDPLIQIHAFPNPAAPSTEAPAEETTEEQHSEFTTGSSALNVPLGLLGQLVDLITKVFGSMRAVISG